MVPFIIMVMLKLLKNDSIKLIGSNQVFIEKDKASIIRFESIELIPVFNKYKKQYEEILNSLKETQTKFIMKL